MITYPVSPNTVLANALTRAEDLLRPHIVEAAPEHVVFMVGTQINGAPHIGTSLVQSLTFATAARIRDRYDVPTEVHFSALDNAPHTIVTDEKTGHRYQRAYAHALGTSSIAEQIDKLYRPLFTALSERLQVPYVVETYSEQQASEHFRRTWLRVLPRMSAARWHLSPSSGIPHLRVPCPQPGCGWTEKHAERTRVRSHDREKALRRATRSGSVALARCRWLTGPAVQVGAETFLGRFEPWAVVGHEYLAQRLVQGARDRIDRGPDGSVTHDSLKVVRLEHHLVEPVRQHKRLIAREPDGDRFLVHDVNLAPLEDGVSAPTAVKDQHAFQLCW